MFSLTARCGLFVFLVSKHIIFLGLRICDKCITIQKYVRFVLPGTSGWLIDNQTTWYQVEKWRLHTEPNMLRNKSWRPYIIVNRLCLDNILPLSNIWFCYELISSGLPFFKTRVLITIIHTVDQNGFQFNSFTVKLHTRN